MPEIKCDYGHATHVSMPQWIDLSSPSFILPRATGHQPNGKYRAAAIDQGSKPVRAQVAGLGAPALVGRCADDQPARRKDSKSEALPAFVGRAIDAVCRTAGSPADDGPV